MIILFYSKIKIFLLKKLTEKTIEIYFIWLKNNKDF